MAKLVSQVRPVQNESAQQESQERGDAGNSPLATAFGGLLVLLLIAGAVFCAIYALQLQPS
jgi:hypothetical protein